MRQHQLQVRARLQHAAEDQMMHRHRGIQRIADDIGEVMIAEAPRLGEAGRMHEDRQPEFLGFAEDRPEPVGSDRSSPATLVAISMPRSPSERCSRSSSATASSGAWNGTVPRPTKRSGMSRHDVGDVVVDHACRGDAESAGVS